MICVSAEEVVELHVGLFNSKDYFSARLLLHATVLEIYWNIPDVLLTSL